ncbi:phosphoinositide phosphatase SAC6-like [Andrographis paniculata]|uniref:phosphoinositide phosphatase SAC6-like n=1 Tax=Andrographis paniculata TaxID=175694 RepID=UPI0021E80458|nr:phosphoinositide phosphatase SAC6-like [Andrographis paniculata]
MMERGDPAPKLFNRMRLWEFTQHFVVEPTDGSSAPFIAISRLDGSFKLTDDVPEVTLLGAPKIWNIFGVVGVLKILAGLYLFVITERECVGNHMGFPIFKITSMKCFPCDHSPKKDTEEQNKMEREVSQLISIAERTPGLYFSYDVNITLRTQLLHDLGDETKLLPLWRQADPRFLWNSYMLEVLKDNKLDAYLLPVMQGSFQRTRTDVGGVNIDVTLIARRCTRRLGTRMWRRGADSDGFVANFVETEQILRVHGWTASFVQIRGSIPLLWEQIVDLTYKPIIKLIRPDETPKVFEKHFLDLNSKYGDVHVIDLVNTHGGEGCLCKNYSSAMQNLANDSVRYIHFDFHRICGDTDMGWLSILYHKIQAFLFKNRYFLLNEKGDKVQGQLGIVRTNCVDCLDRTNVTQSMIARKTLEAQLKRLGVFGDGETISSQPKLDSCFKIMWANHGDAVSTQYTGTPALKRDIVRCGERTIQGALQDGWSALMRYFLNNFRDGMKQDAMDLLQGRCTISPTKIEAPKTKKDEPEFVLSVPMGLTLIMLSWSFSLNSLRRARKDPWCLVFTVMWACISMLILSILKSNGRNLCSRPRPSPQFR